MTFAVIHSRASIGIHAPSVTVEAHITGGLPGLHIVGLPETVVKESRDRVRSAIINSRFEFPARRITVNLAPADLPKHGCRYDLPIALSILVASKQIPNDRTHEFEFAGELGLSGDLRPVHGILPFALGTKNAQRILCLPSENAAEAALVNDLSVVSTNSLLEVCQYLLQQQPIQFYQRKFDHARLCNYPDLQDVKGQHHARRALEIAAAGQHGLLLTGPPGVGKTLLSHCMLSILPKLDESQSVELATIQSVAGHKLDIQTWGSRPFRHPHHSASSYALIGGGNPPKPGEISLAHHGILFLDELPEFKRQSLEALREPLESGTISISRASHQVQYPARFQLIAAMNPCPCGYYTDTSPCNCTLDQVRKYQSRISGPLLDRIDLQIELRPLPSLFFTENNSREENSATVLKRVMACKAIQLQRGPQPNALLNNHEMDTFCKVERDDLISIEQILKQRQISARAFHKILKIARTIADLEGVSMIRLPHLKEALSYRHFDTFKRSF